MAISAPVGFNETVYNSPTPIGSLTASAVNIGTRTNGLLLVKVGLHDASPGNVPDVSTVTWNGVTVTKRSEATYTSGNDDYVAEIWSLKDPDDATVGDGAHDCVVTFTASTITKAYIQLSWYDGVNQTNEFGNQTSATGTTDPTADLLPPEDNCMIVSFYVSEANAPITVGTGETLIAEEDWGAQVTGSSYVIQTTATTQTMDWTGPDANWAMAVASFKAAAEAAGQPTMLRTQGIPTGAGQRDRPGKWN